jgi:thiol-disulfide isomerase/thioredoxin/tRNA A-37 threonylcarbamoyl transferase component Bud32
MVGAMQPTQAGDAANAMPPPTPEELAPHFPQLEILECLGRGGMGVVYKARQKSLNRLVALKLLAPERADDPQFAARFEKEAQALAALNHPHIVAVHDFGRAGGFYFLLMEFVDGVNLRKLLQTKRLTPKEALSIVPPVCDALQCAHEHGIVHRDIKPENLLMDKAGVVKIADFGIAKIIAASADEKGGGAPATSSGAATLALGTPDYAAPEQHEANGDVDHRADIYSLGVVLYEMLTGERPEGKIEAPSKRVQVDIRIDEIVLRALEKEPELRFRTAAEFGTRVESVAQTQQAPTRPIKETARPKAILAGSGARLLGCLVAFVIGVPLLLLLVWIASAALSHKKAAAEEARAAQQAADRAVEIPALRDGKQEFPDSAGKLRVWADHGWWLAKREARSGELEWQIVLARVGDAEAPRISVQPEDGSLEVRSGQFFIRENLGELRVLREKKSKGAEDWPQVDFGSEPKSVGFGGMGPVLEGWKADGWCWLTSGADRTRHDAWIRLLPEPLMDPGRGFSAQRGLAEMFAGKMSAQDDGSLLVAKRMPFFLAQRELKMRQTRAEHRPAPEIEAQQWFHTEGALSLPALRGKVVLLDFWGQWCAPCVEKLPKTEALYQRFKDRGLVAIGVHSSNSAENLDAFLKTRQITFPIALDTGATAERYAVEAWPTYYLVDRTGRIVWGGGHDLPEDDQITKLLEQSEPAKTE